MASDGKQSYILFIYREIRWGRDIATAGFNAGDGLRYYALIQPQVKSNVTLERDSNIDVPGVYAFRVDPDDTYLPLGKLAFCILSKVSPLLSGCYYIHIRSPPSCTRGVTSHAYIGYNESLENNCILVRILQLLLSVTFYPIHHMVWSAIDSLKELGSLPSIPAFLTSG